MDYFQSSERYAMQKILGRDYFSIMIDKKSIVIQRKAKKVIGIPIIGRYVLGLTDPAGTYTDNIMQEARSHKVDILHIHYADILGQPGKTAQEGRKQKTQEMMGKGRQHASKDIAAPSTHIIDLSENAEQLWENIHPSLRKKILRTQNDASYHVNYVGEQDYHLFYQGRLKTAQEKAIHIISYDQFVSLAHHLTQTKTGAVWGVWNTEEHDKKDNEAIVAGTIIFSTATEDVYLYGFALRGGPHQNSHSPHGLLHRQCILDAQSRVQTVYDFMGIAPTRSSNHPLAGVSRFKQQRGGLSIDGGGSREYCLTYRGRTAMWIKKLFSGSA